MFSEKVWKGEDREDAMISQKVIYGLTSEAESHLDVPSPSVNLQHDKVGSCTGTVSTNGDQIVPKGLRIRMSDLGWNVQLPVTV